MDQVEIYKVVTAGKRRRYPAIVRKGLLGKDCARGRCQAQFCKERSSYVRAWLNPDNVGQYTTSALNGVRYCRTHTEALAAASQLPVFRTRADVNAYHTEVVAHEQVFPTESDAIVADPDRSVRFVGPHGFIIIAPHGRIDCESLNGTSIPACCIAEARHLVGMSGKSSVSRHAPGCHIGDDIAHTREMASHRRLTTAPHARSPVRY